MFNLLLTLFCGIALASTSPVTPKTTTPPPKSCGYQTCHELKEGLINVHIVPHTHDDVGWLKTVDQYYFGSKTSVQKAGVQYILDSVIDALRRDPSRRFIYVETAFFWKWWQKQHDAVKHQVKRFIQNGQLEMIGGAWSMNDEGTTHYQSIIDQFTWGLRKLNETFGPCGRPKIGWQIDPFGHSREMASIFAQLGFDGLLLGRIDYQDKQSRFKTKTPEFLWRGSDNLGNKSQLFTTVMYNVYSPPPGFCFDVLCSDEPIIDDKRSPDYNVDKRLADFFKFLDDQRKVYPTGNIIVTMGGDFTYMEANMWFKNLDKLIRYANQRQANGSVYNLIYSTPSCYQKAVLDAGKNKVQWSIKADDFFPYASDSHSYWTGYFTSRPTLKRYERLGNNYLQICKQLYALTDLGPEDWTDLNALREAMGIMQHHDAVTGTEKEHVAHDYARILSKGFDECEFIVATALSKLVSKSGTRRDPTPEIPFQSCLLANVSQCEFTENSKSFIVTAYNPLSRPVSHYVRLPITGKSYTVTDPSGAKTPVQLIPISDPISKIPGRMSQANSELLFLAENLPPLGFKSFYVSESAAEVPKQTPNVDYDVKIKVDQNTGKLYEVTMNGVNISLAQEFYYYRGSVGDNREAGDRSSGAYIFRPNGTEPIKISNKTSYQVYYGEVVTELHQTFNDWVSQIIRIYGAEKFVEFDWLIGPIPVDDVNGKEVITKYVTNLNSDSSFYTDSNGRELLRRQRDFRPTWQLELAEPISGNYYPVTSKILIRDPSRNIEVAVLTDRAQGGSSLKNGEIELMLHRNCLYDDAFGVGEALNETAFGEGLVARGSHYLVLGPYLNSSGISLAAAERDIAQRKLLSAWTFLSPTNGLSYDDYKAKYNTQYSGLTRSLPNNVQILTLEPWKGMSFLLRLEHVLERNEDPVLSKPVTVNLKDLFSAFDIVWYRETTLGANQWLDENERPQFGAGEDQDHLRLVEELDGLYQSKIRNEYTDEDDLKLRLGKWKRNQLKTNDIGYESYVKDNSYNVTLTPMQIRTFVIEIQKKN